MKTTVTKNEVMEGMERYIDSCGWTTDGYDEYEYEPTQKGLSTIYEKFIENKASIIKMMEKSPHYNGKYQIVLSDESYDRKIDDVEVWNFFSELMRKIEEKLPESSSMDVLSKWEGKFIVRYSCCQNLHILMCVLGEEKNHLYAMPVAIAHDCRNYFNWFDLTCEIISRSQIFETITPKEFVKSFDNSEHKIIPLFKLLSEEGDDWVNYLEKKISTKCNKDYSEILKQRFFVREMRSLVSNTNGFVNEALVALTNETYPKLRPAVGQKLSRFVNKFCIKVLKVDDSRGSEYQRVFSRFSDAVNPLKIKRWSVLSVHPVDFLAMSNGKDWRSCHTIDQLTDEGENHGGCCGAGTLSYMLDKVSMVFYTVSKEYEGDEFEFEPKVNRNMFHYGEDKLIQGRVYPQDNDGVNSIYDKIRPIVQRVIAEAEDKPNLWRNTKGTSTCQSVIKHTGVHYPDTNYFENCNVSWYGTSRTEKNHTRIVVGHAPICPRCGRVHNNQDNILCTDCQVEIADIKTCARCGYRVDPDDAVYDEDTGNIYCDDECAAYDGCYWCENVNEYHSEDVYYDEYLGEYFYDCDDERIETEDGLIFIDADVAVAAGYVYKEDIGWIDADSIEEDEIA